MVFCASPNTLHTRKRKGVEGPSSGITKVGDEMREAVVRREARVCVDGLFVRRGAVEFRVAVLPGILTENRELIWMKLFLE